MSHDERPARQPAAKPCHIAPADRVHGALTLPADKSLAHRALILAALARGRSIIRCGALGRDVRSTRGALEALGVHIEAWDEGLYVDGRGADGFEAPARPLDCGNSGTTMRLLLGALAAQPFALTLDGDASLRRRPMGRVLGPLEDMGARFHAREGGPDGRLAPITIHGGATLRGRHHRLAIPSAQLKSAILLAALAAEGRTTIEQPIVSRDHTERMLRLFGADVLEPDGCIELEGPAELCAARVEIPGDLSAAAFWLVAAAALPGSRVVLRDVGINPTRTGALEVLERMGLELHRGETRWFGFEPVADLFAVGPDRLAPFAIGAGDIPRLVDEIPALCMLATRAEGVSEVRGAEELRVKESDRIAATAALIRALGGRCEELPDGLRIAGPQRLSGGVIDPAGDHRLAMAGAVAALFCEHGARLADPRIVEISYPGFFDGLEALARR